MKDIKSVLFAAGCVLAGAFIFSCSSDDGGNGKIVYGSPVTYEGKTYQTVIIGTQTWMAENLNYAAVGSKCLGEGGPVLIDDENDNRITKTLSNAEVQANCDKYGRLYDWPTAMALPSSCNSDFCSDQIQSPHRGICPAGWHIPNDDDWSKLFRYVDNENGGSGEEDEGIYVSYTAGKHLKATSGWNSRDGVSGNGTDKYGFRALPGGAGKNGNFYGGEGGGIWRNTSEGASRVRTYSPTIGIGDDVRWGGDPKSSLWSVRCVKD
ncbi:MAG: hypothetical protein LBQ87_07570 [Candidatus Fibromonas sp.]|jgi:uncharacterized protein (TIGR02145 family)|nr:hypothetical protein [Candidatus Fibromonas sp.]